MAVDASTELQTHGYYKNDGFLFSFLFGSVAYLFESERAHEAVVHVGGIHV